MVSRIFLRKDVQIGLRLNETEYLKTSILAKSCNLSKSTYVSETAKTFSGPFKFTLPVGRREKQISIRINEIDFDLLKEKAIANRLSIQNYLRIIINSIEIPKSIEEKITIK